MKRKNKVFDIFNLSFLDVISCGFGAVVLLVLISKHTDAPQGAEVTEIETLLSQVITLENSITSLTSEIEREKEVALKNQSQIVNLKQKQLDKEQQLASAKEEGVKIGDDLKGLSLVAETLEKVSITPATTKTIRDEEVGGIPVDSDYVIFIVDTSGSMLAIWDRVSREILNVLRIHPEVKGFQILNDQGKSLITGYTGRWIPDTPNMRNNVMKVFDDWRDASNSSPVEGIQTALRLYTRDGQSTAIYVFGDDYTGSSYDQAVGNITKLNRSQQSGQRLAKIHAVGFLSKFTTGRFAVLMREITKRNGGTFLALPI